MKRFHETLGPLVEGWAVVRVEPGRGREGDPARIILQKGSRTREFEIFGGVFGPAVSSVVEGESRDPYPCYVDVSAMFQDIVDHLAYLPSSGSEGEDPDSLVELEGADHYGFRCRETGREWWIRKDRVEASAHCGEFASAELRGSLSRVLSRLQLPRPQG